MPALIFIAVVLILIKILLCFADIELTFRSFDKLFLLVLEGAELGQELLGRLVAGVGPEVLVVDVDVGAELV